MTIFIYDMVGMVKQKTAKILYYESSRHFYKLIYYITGLLNL